MDMTRRAAAEFFGTLWLVFGGCGAAVLAAAFPSLGIGFLGVALAFGLTVLTMAYAVGHISGGHFNPAVTIGLWAGGRFKAADVLPYIIAQVIGAIVAAGVLYLIASGKPGWIAGGFASNGFGDLSPGKYGLGACFITEIVATFFFLFVIIGSTSKGAAVGFAGIPIGLGLTLIHLITIPVTHDEVVHGKGSLIGKMPGDEWRRFAGLRSLLAYMWAHPGKQLLFMGSEWGQVSEWSADNGLDWWVLEFDVHQGVQRLSRDLNAIYRQTPALWQLDSSPEGFSWIDSNDALGNTLSFLRWSEPSTSAAAGAADEPAGPDERDVIACIANFSALPHLEYKVGLPRAGRWREVLNTDAVSYGGSGVGNLGVIEAVPEPWHGKPASATITVPPLGVLWLTPEP